MDYKPIKKYTSIIVYQCPICGEMQDGLVGEAGAQRHIDNCIKLGKQRSCSHEWSYYSSSNFRCLRRRCDKCDLEETRRMIDGIPEDTVKVLWNILKEIPGTNVEDEYYP